jgi:hypothetical protein
MGSPRRTLGSAAKISTRTITSNHNYHAASQPSLEPCPEALSPLARYASYKVTVP